MPIRGLTEATRIARAGKIRMGVRVKNANGPGDHPKSVDHFVCPPSVLEYLTPARVRYCAGACGEEPGPVELPIVFPVDDVERIASQHYRAYKRAGLVCKGDGYVARGMLVPAAAGITIDQHPKSVETWAADGQWREFKCLGEGYDGEPACPLYATANGCRKMMILQFLILDVPGLEVWQLDTGSVNSILNVNSTLNVLASIRGGVAGVPMMLRAEPYEVNVNGKRTKITAIRLSYDVTPREVLEMPRVGETAAVAQLAAPDDAQGDDETIDVEARLVEDPTPVAHDLEQQRQRDCREVADLLTEAWQNWQGKNVGQRDQLRAEMKSRWPAFMSPAGNLQPARLTAAIAKDVLAFLRARVRGEADPDGPIQPGEGAQAASAAVQPTVTGYDGDPARPPILGPPREAATSPHEPWCSFDDGDGHGGPCARLHYRDCAGPDDHADACPEPDHEPVRKGGSNPPASEQRPPPAAPPAPLRH